MILFNRAENGRYRVVKDGRIIDVSLEEAYHLWDQIRDVVTADDLRAASEEAAEAYRIQQEEEAQP